LIDRYIGLWLNKFLLFIVLISYNSEVSVKYSPLLTMNTVIAYIYIYIYIYIEREREREKAI
jgi:hypothetical protein